MENDDAELNEAIVLYLRRYPGSNRDEFDSRFGPAAAAVMERVRAILDEAVRVEPDWNRMPQRGRRLCGGSDAGTVSEPHAAGPRSYRKLLHFSETLSYSRARKQPDKATFDEHRLLLGR